MNAEELTRALHGQWRGSSGMAKCPAHDDRNPSLSLKDSDDGTLLVHCHAGCPQDAMLAVVKGRGLWFSSGDRPPSQFVQHCRDNVDDDALVRTEQARAIWDQAMPAADSIIENYLRSRAITLPPPGSLRYHPNLTYNHTGTEFPAMVAAVQAPDGTFAAIHRTFLLPGGEGKAQITSPKMALGPIGSGAVRLAKAGSVLGLAEGIETALSAMQLFDVPTWAALGSRLDQVALPETVRHVIIYADNGDAGLVVAHKAVKAFTHQGRRVTLRLPP